MFYALLMKLCCFKKNIDFEQIIFLGGKIRGSHNYEGATIRDNTVFSCQDLMKVYIMVRSLETLIKKK